MPLQKNYLLVGSIALIILAGAIFFASSSTEKRTDISTKITPAPTSTPAPAPISLRLGYLPTSGHALEFIAKENGFFAEQGLDVELFEFSNSAEGHNALLAKKLDLIAMGTAAPQVFIAKGTPFVLIGGLMSEGAGVIAKPEKAAQFKDIKNFRNKTVATVRMATGDAVWRGALYDAGINWQTDLKIEELKSPSAVLEAVKTDKVDAGVVWLPFMDMAEAQGLVVVKYTDEYFPDHPCCRVTVDRETLTKDRTTYVKYEKALIKSYKFFKTNQNETVDAISKYVKIDKDLIRKSIYTEHFFASPDPNKKGIIRFWEMMNKIGYINSTADINQFIDTTVYKQALDEIIKENPNDAFYKSLLEEYRRLNE